MQSEEFLLHRKRQAYQRRQTLASLPVPLLLRSDPARAGDDCSMTGRHQWLISSGGGGGGGRGRSVLLSSRASIPGGIPQEARRSLSGGNVSEIDALRTTHPTRGGGGGGAGGSVSSAGGHSHHHHDPTETRRHGSSSSTSSFVGARTLSGSGVGSQQPPPHTKRLGRTPSSPSVLLSKVKERIREKVFETSAEWPHMAAIVQERRQRAADAFEARLSLRRMRMASGDQDAEDDIGLPLQPIQLQQQQSRTRRVRIRSDPAHHRRTSSSGSSSSSYGGGGGGVWGGGVGGGCVGSSSLSFDKDGAKVAFRRRSISDDTYTGGGGGRGGGHHHQQRMMMMTRKSSSDDRGGIVCSDDDLRAIVFEHRLRRSPVPVKHQEDTVVMDLCDEVTGDSTVFSDSLANIPSAATSATVGPHGGGGGGGDGGGLGAASAPTVCTVRDRSSQLNHERRTSSSQDVILYGGRGFRDTAALVSSVPPPAISPSRLRDDRSPPQENGGDRDRDLAGVMEQRQQQKEGKDKEVEEQEEEVDDGEEEEEEEDKAAVVPDVVFDEHGQTWDVYGAEFDPEILGQAIQGHLEKIMKRRMSEKGSCCAEGKPDHGDLESPEKIYRKEMVYGATDSHEANDRALGFFLRYLCFLARSRENAAQNS